MPQYIEAVEQGYREVGFKRGSNFPRESLWVPGDQNETTDGGHLPAGVTGALKFKAALLPELGGAGVQAYTVGLGALETFMFLFETRTGSLVAIMEVLYYDWLKTAAVTAVATKYLAPQDSSVVALFGTGRHARTQLHGLCAVRPINRVQAYSRNAERRAAFCRRMSEELGVEVVPVDSAAAALKDADIVTTITTSPTPVFAGNQLDKAKAVHINALGAHYPWVREVDEDVVLNSRVIVDEWEQGLREQGELLIPMEQKLIDTSHVAGDLGAVVSGQVVGRGPNDRWTLFLSGGTGIEDVAVATKLYEAAKAQGVGTTFEFNQPYEFAL